MEGVQNRSKYDPFWVDFDPFWVIFGTPLFELNPMVFRCFGLFWVKNGSKNDPKMGQNQPLGLPRGVSYSTIGSWAGSEGVPVLSSGKSEGEGHIWPGRGQIRLV